MLAQNVRLGLIASSDHWSNSFSFAVVYAEQPTREAIFSALTARRCYATTNDREMIVLNDDLKVKFPGVVAA